MRIELNRTEKALTDRSLLGLTELNEARADDDDEEDVGIKYQKPDGAAADQEPANWETTKPERTTSPGSHHSQR